MSGGLTGQDIKDVQSDWEAVRSKEGGLTAFGMRFFIKLFQSFPAYLKLFKKFQNLSLAEVEKSPALRNHAASFCRAVDGAVLSLEHVEVVHTLVQEVGRAHKARGVKPEHVKATMTVFQKCLKEELSQTSNVSAWDKVLSVLTEDIVKGLNKN